MTSATPVTILRPLRAIRERCLDCSGGSVKNVRECPVTACTLWPYRMGHRPAKPRVAQPEGGGQE